MKTVISSRVDAFSWILMPLLALLGVLQLGNTDIFTGLAEVHFNALIVNNLYILLACQQVWRIDRLRTLIIPRIPMVTYVWVNVMKSLLRIVLFYGVEVGLLFTLLPRPFFPGIEQVTILLLVVYVFQFVLIEICANSVLFDVKGSYGLVFAICINLVVHYYIAMTVLGRTTGLYGV